MYRDHEFELLPDHPLYRAGPEPPKRRTLEETIGFAQQVERAVLDGKSATAIKAIISNSGVKFASPFFSLWSGFTLEQIRPDLPHMIQVLGRRHVQAHTGRRDPKEVKAAKPTKAGGGSAVLGGEAAGGGLVAGEAVDREEKEEKERKEDGEPVRVDRVRKKRKSSAKEGQLPGGGKQREASGRRTKHRRTNDDFVNLDDFESDWSGDDGIAVAEEVDFDGELAEDDNVPGGHVDYEVERIMNERGGVGQDDHEYLVLWKHWSAPTWESASGINDSVPHEVTLWESVRNDYGWPNINEAAQRRELAVNERAETKRRLIRLRVKDAVTNAADKFIAEKLITPAGFSPRPSQLPCQRISSLNIWTGCDLLRCGAACTFTTCTWRPMSPQPCLATLTRCACCSSVDWDRSTAR